MKTITILLLIISTTFSLAYGELTIKKTATAPVIDGIGNENIWQTIEAKSITKSNGKTLEAGFAANFKMCYDDDNIYVLVNVTDQTPNQDGSSSWQSDCVALYFAMDSSNSQLYRSGDWQIRKVSNKTQNTGIDGVEGEGTNAISSIIVNNNFKVIQKDLVQSYTQEWQLPISALVKKASFNGKAFRFDVECTDNDGTGKQRTGHLFWNSNADNQWEKVLNQGFIFLETPFPDTTTIGGKLKICVTTVTEDFKNIIVWERPSNPNIDSIFVFRESTSATDVYDFIGGELNSNPSFFIDENSSALIQSSKYKIAAGFSTINYNTPKSEPHKTMHLNINKGQDNIWNLIWEPYEGFAVKSYKIYRGTAISDMKLIGSTSGSATSYSDFFAPEGAIYYQIEVVSPNVCNTLKSTIFSSSKSNIASNRIISTVTLTNYSKSSPIYPNPVKDILHINNDLKEVDKIEMYTAAGILIKSTKSKNDIDVKDFNQGLYILRLTGNQGSVTLKFVKE